jgi:hypothetical protein
MFMAPVASVITIIIVDMTGCTLGIVMAIKTEILRMIKIGRKPAFLIVARSAVTLNL